MKILSLFDGMACGMIAMQNAGVTVDRYVAYEIDKNAIQTATHNFPMIEECGDVFKADFTQYEGFDWLIGGSPCTYWSIAQKNNRETEASGMGWELFSQYVRALHEAKPKFFIYENNKSMSQAIRESISQTFGFEPICINSALLSAQNRQRLYWVGRRNEDGTYSKVNVEQPQDKGILLKDILEDGIVDKDKAYCLKHQAGNARDYFKKHHTQIKYEPVESKTINKAIPGIVDKLGYLPEMFNAYNRAEITDKSPTLSTGSMVTSSCAVSIIENIERYAYATPCEWDEDGRPTKAISSADGKTHTVYEVKDGQITIKGKQYPIKLADGYYIIRKLTVRECMRLQTVPEWYEFPVSDSQAYKMLGNGWTCDVITYLINTTISEWLDELLGGDE